MSGVGKTRSRALEGPREASRASRSLSSFDSRGFLWSLSLDQSVGASEAWLFCAGHLYSQNEVLSSNKLADPLDIDILEL